MSHESTVNPNDYMGDDMNNMVNRISRSLNLATSESNIISDPSRNIQETTQEGLTNLAEYYENKTLNSPLTDRNRKLFYGSNRSECENPKFGATIKRNPDDQILRPKTPSTLTHFEDLDEDDDSEESKSLENKIDSPNKEY